MGGPVSRSPWVWVGVLSAGCNALAGIDQDYVPADDTLAGTGSVGTGVGAEGGLNGAGGEGGAWGIGGADGSGGEVGGGTDGASGNGGTDPSDAAGGVGGSGGTTGTDGAGGTGGGLCGPNQKRCGDACIDPSPNLGCSLADCNPCPDPAPNSEVFCAEQQCVARCKSGYVPVGGQCVPQNSVDAGGGAGGSAGSGSSGRGGSGGRCVASDCPSCSPFRGFACCTFFGDCGCGFVDRFYCL